MYKAISIGQPFASAIVHNIKRFETRSWKTEYRGRLYIHSVARFDDKLVRTFLSKSDFNDELSAMHSDTDFRFAGDYQAMKFYKELPRASILGYCDIVDCVQTEHFETIHSTNSTTWQREDALGFIKEGYFMWQLENVVMFNSPVEFVRGKERIWNVDKHLFGQIMQTALMHGIKTY